MTTGAVPGASSMRAGARLDLTRLLNPRAVAVVGASRDERRIGGQPLKILRETAYRGGVYPVNPGYPEIGGRPCFPDVIAVPRPCDVALVAVSAPRVPEIIEQCGAAGIPFAVVLSAGFREAGEAGAQLEARLKASAARSGVRVVGPNCIGLMNLADRVYLGFGAGFRNPRLKPGPVAFVSQSGGFAFSVVGLADFEGIGFNYIISAGNEADISTLDLVADFLERDDVEIVVTYLEGIADGTRLREIGVRALELGKPILIWKVGNSEVGRAAAESHTASMTAAYTLYRTAFEEGGFVEIADVHDMVDAARAFQGRRLPKGRNVAVITTSGGSGVLIADACDRHGLALPRLGSETVQAIAPVAPSHTSFANPLDLTAQITGDADSFNRITEHVLADPRVDQLVLRYGAVQGAIGESWAKRLAEIVRGSDKPVLVAWSRVPDRSEPSLQILERNRIPWLLTPTRAAFAAGALYAFARKRTALAERRARGGKRLVARQPLELPPGRSTLSEHESKACLASYGIAVTREVLLSPREVAALEQPPVALPLVVKIDSPDLPHKTEAHAVRLNVNGLAELKEQAAAALAAALAYRPQAHVNGVLVSEMARGVEVIIGAINDRYFGPVVMFGLGGVLTELAGDVAYRFAPFDVATAREMILELRASRLLTGYRGRPPVALEALAEMLSRVSLLAADHADRVAEIDVNPVFVDEARAVAADALIVLRD